MQVSRWPLRSFISSVLVSAALAGCGFREEKNLGGLRLSSQENVLRYAAVHERVFRPSCIGCHGNSGGVNLESFAAVKAVLDRIDRAVLVDRTMPKGGPLPDSESKLLADWIKAGAPESPTPLPSPSAPPSPIPEEPLKPTYTSIRSKIFVPRCLGCHNINGMPGARDVPLSPLKDLLDSPRMIVVPGDLEESGLWIFTNLPDENPKRMPPPGVGSRLSHSELSVIREWIEDGAPEN